MEFRAELVDLDGRPVELKDLTVLDLDRREPRRVEFTAEGGQLAFTTAADGATLWLSVYGVDHLPAYRAVVAAGDRRSLGPITLVEPDRGGTLIGVEGGVVRDQRGTVEVVIPPRALTQPTAIRVTARPTTAALPAPVVTVPGELRGVELEPDGQQFAVPVTVKILDQTMPSTEVPIWTLDLDRGAWIDHGRAFDERGVVAFTTTHFSSYGWPRTDRDNPPREQCFWCADGNRCTTDACAVERFGCTHTWREPGADCSDGVVCNGDEVCGVIPVFEPPGWYPAPDWQPTLGMACMNRGATTDDGDACTIDACTEADGVTHVDACDDGNPCTADLCAADGSCSHSWISAGTSCDDGNACNGAEVCDGAGTCQAGTKLAAGSLCGDANPCNGIEACDGDGACISPGDAAAGTACGDRELCNGAEACDGHGACLAGAPSDDGAPCDDGNPCTAGDACGAGACKGGAAAGACDDANPCTSDDTCAAGICAGTAWTGPRPDGDLCNGDESCLFGVAMTSAGIAIDDGDPDTLDVCNPDTGAIDHAACQGSLSVTTTGELATDCLWHGPDPLQTGLDGSPLPADAFAVESIAVIHGQIRDADGDAVAGVRLTKLAAHGADDPAVGKTYSRADGSFDLVVAGGAPVTVTFTKPGWLPSQRTVTVPWQGVIALDDVTLLTAAPATVIDPATAGEIAIVRGQVVSDARGTRQATVLLDPGTTLTMQVRQPDGSLVATPLTGPVHVRATEYTVGPAGPSAMPGTLPPSSAYTYAVEWSIDEAVAAGAASVEFDHASASEPVVVYLEDFLGFPTGHPVPAGYYDAALGAWLAGPSGRVVTITAIGPDADGVASATVDTVGDVSGLAPLAIDSAERRRLAGLYPVGQRLWRIPTAHFTPWDYNWGAFPPDGAEYPKDRKPDADDKVKTPCKTTGSSIDCQSQVLGESARVRGTPFFLNYRSDRVPGRAVRMELPVTDEGEQWQPNQVKVKTITAKVVVAGRTLQCSTEVAPTPNMVIQCAWDGRNFLGKLVQGAQRAYWQIEHKYLAGYAPTPLFAGSSIAGGGGGGGGGGGPTYAASNYPKAGLVGLAKREWFTLAHWLATPLGLGGWDLSVHHSYDVLGKTLYRGDGSAVQVDDVADKITLVAGGVKYNSSSTFQFKPVVSPMAATSYRVGSPGAVVVAADGTIYFGENSEVLKIDAAGMIDRVMGNGSPGPLPTSLQAPWDLAIGPDGSLYAADAGGNAVVRRSPDGTVSLFAGTGVNGSTGDGGPATAARLNAPQGVAVAADGTVYISEVARIRKVGPDGIISTYAGSGQVCGTGSCPDNQPAGAAAIGAGDLELGADGSLYLADQNAARVWRIAPEGYVQTVAGSTTACASGSLGDGGAANQAQLCQPRGIALSPDGDLYISDMYQHRIRRVRAPLGYPLPAPGAPLPSSGRIETMVGAAPPENQCGITEYCDNHGIAQLAHLGQPRTIAFAPDGTYLVFDTADKNRLLRIESPLPGVGHDDIFIPSEDGGMIFQFDRFGRHLATYHGLTGAVLYSFGYDSKGRLASVTDLAGDTVIGRDAAGNPTTITAPNGEVTDLTVDADGYLASISAAGESIGFTYHGGERAGLLATVTDGEQHVTTIEYDDDGRLASDTDAAGRVKHFARVPLEPLPDEEDFDGWRVDHHIDDLTPANQDQAQFTVKRFEDHAEFSVQAWGAPELTDTTTVTVNSATTAFYDGATVVQTQAPDPRWGMLAPRVGSVTTTIGDHQSQAATSVSADYDPDNLLDLHHLTVSASQGGGQWSSSYDAATDTITRQSPGGLVRTSTIGPDGRVLTDTVPSVVSRTIDYVASGAAVGRTDTITTSDLTNGQSTQAHHAYDQLGRLIAIEHRSGDGAISYGQIGYSYHPDGRVATYTTVDGRVLGFDWDHYGNITALTLPATASGQPVWSSTFDTIGMPESLQAPLVPTDPALDTAAEATTHFGWTPMRKLSYRLDPGGRSLVPSYDAYGRIETVALTTAAGTEAIAYSYAPFDDVPAARGRIASIARPGHATVTFDHSKILLTGESTSGVFAAATGLSWDYDDYFRTSAETVTDAKGGTHQVGFQYGPDAVPVQAGALTLGHNPQATQVTTALDNLTSARMSDGIGHLTAITYAHAGTAIFDEQILERDPFGRITSRQEQFGAEAPIVYDYAYDAGGSVTAAWKDGVAIGAWSYDARGNRTCATLGGCAIDEYSHDAQDRLVSAPVGPGVVSFGYAPTGERVTRTDGATITSYTYDGYGNLVTVAKPGLTISYVLDGRGRRVGQRTNGVLTRGWLWHGGHLVAAFAADGGLRDRYVYGSSAVVPDYLERHNPDGTWSRYQLVRDHLGSVRQVVDTTTGLEVQRLSFDVYGATVVDTNPGFQPFGFAGGLWTAETGLYRFGARDYDPTVGRWLERDPLGFAAGDVNLYGYVGNDPVNQSDPSGLSPQSDIINAPVLGTIFGAFGIGVQNRADGILMMSNDATAEQGERLAAMGACQLAIGAKIAGLTADAAVTAFTFFRDMGVARSGGQVLDTAGRMAIGSSRLGNAVSYLTFGLRNAARSPAAQALIDVIAMGMDISELNEVGIPNGDVWAVVTVAKWIFKAVALDSPGDRR